MNRFALAFCLFASPVLAGDATAESSVKLMEKFSDVVVGTGSDCPKLAKSLDSFITENHDALVAMGKRGQSLTLEQKKAESAKYKKQLDAANQKMRPVITACKKDEGVRTSMARFSEAGMGPFLSIGSPSRLNTRPSVDSPTGTDTGAPVFQMVMPRMSPSVEPSATARTRFPPRCCCTSQVRRWRSPPSSISVTSAS